jgi:hypothetical protein
VNTTVRRLHPQALVELAEHVGLDPDQVQAQLEYRTGSRFLVESVPGEPTWWVGTARMFRPDDYVTHCTECRMPIACSQEPPPGVRVVCVNCAEDLPEADAEAVGREAGSR